jgi:hypothetical protein
VWESPVPPICGEIGIDDPPGSVAARENGMR